MLKPISARHELMARCCQSSPLAESVQKALSTPSGDGKIRVESQPTEEANCHTITLPTGKSQGYADQEFLRKRRHTVFLYSLAFCLVTGINAEL
jgi:hypothetical protein